MEHQKILNLLNEANDSKFVTRKWNIVNENSTLLQKNSKKTILNCSLDLLIVKNNINNGTSENIKFIE